MGERCSDTFISLGKFKVIPSKARQDILYEVLQLNTRLSHMGCQVKFMCVCVCVVILRGLSES